MNSERLANLAKIKDLKFEPPAQAEFDELLRSGRACLNDARNPGNSIDSRFTLAYDAAHSFARAALRWHGYRSENRYLVFQTLGSTLDLLNAQCRVLTLCHDKRNKRTYEGAFDIDEKLVVDLIQVAGVVLQMAERLGPIVQAPR